MMKMLNISFVKEVLRKRESITELFNKNLEKKEGKTMKKLSILLLIVLLGTVSYSATWTIPSQISDLQFAANTASNGDTIQIVQAGSYNTTGSNFTTNVVVTATVSGVTIKNQMNVESPATSVTFNNLIINGLNIGIYCNTIATLTVSNCIIDTTSSGVSMQTDSTGTFVITNTIMRNNAAGRGWVLQNGGNITVTNCVFNNVNAGITAQSIDGANSVTGTITGTLFENMATGFWPWGTPATVTLSNDTFSANEWDAIRVDNGSADTTTVGTVLTINSCYFNQGNRTAVLSDQAGVSLIFNNCISTQGRGDTTFYNEPGVVEFNYLPANGPGCNLYMNGCNFSGNTQDCVYIGTGTLLSSMTIINCTFNSNSGGGIYAANLLGTTSFYISNSMISSNLCVLPANPTLFLNCNQATGLPTGTISQCKIIDGSANTQDLVEPRGCNATIVNSLLVGGSKVLHIESGLVKAYFDTIVGTTGDGVADVWAPETTQPLHEVKGCIISGTTTGINSYNGSSTSISCDYDLVNCATQYGTGIIATHSYSGSPSFVGAGNYQLNNNSMAISRVSTSFSWSSPITTDILGNARPAPVGSLDDIGAYENQVQATYLPSWKRF